MSLTTPAYFHQYDQRQELNAATMREAMLFDWYTTKRDTVVSRSQKKLMITREPVPLVCSDQWINWQVNGGHYRQLLHFRSFRTIDTWTWFSLMLKRDRRLHLNREVKVNKVIVIVTFALGNKRKFLYKPTSASTQMRKCLHNGTVDISIKTVNISCYYRLAACS